MAPKPVFTTSMAAEEVRNRFRFKVSLLFALMVALGIGAMWAVAYTHTTLSKDVQWIFMGASIVLLSITSVLRNAATWTKALAMVLGMCAAGTVGAISAPRGPAMIPFLLNPTLIIGVPLAGLLANLMFTKKDRTQFAHFLMTLPWVVLAMIMTWFYPAGETIMAISGTISLIFILLLLIAASRAQPIYRPDEAGKAAVDVLPLVLLPSAEP